MEEESAPLPVELITEILVRLPVKSLLRFKIVSKSWYALIRSPYFVNQHLKHDHKETMLFLSRMLLNPHTIEGKFNGVMSLHVPDSSDFGHLSTKFPVRFVDSDDVFRDLVGPCNGLFFISYWSPTNTSMLCNPALREFKVLPPRPSYLRRNEVFDNLGDGFGFDPLTGSYKVIGIYNMKLVSSPPGVELYDSRTNCWRIIDSTHEMLPYVCYSFGLFFRGACHWETRYEDSSQRPAVLCFDVSNEVFRHFEYPKWDGGYDDTYRMITLRDRLTLIRYPGFSHLPISASIDIWVMEEYGVKESWAQTFKIALNGPVRPIPLFWKDEWILVGDRDGVPKSIDLHNGELGRAFTLRGLHHDWDAAVFKESLVSLEDVICNAQDG